MAHLGIYELADQHFPDRILLHRLEFLGVEALEASAAHLADADFPQQEALRFLRQVCRWGGYYGIAARVQRDNQPEAIRQAFIGASQRLAGGNVVDALGEINALRSLSRPSFASKFVRFLAPRSAPILDRIISNHAGFPLNAEGYGQLIEACQTAAARLVEVNVLNPVRPNGLWFIADIEAAFYADMGNFEA